MGRMQLESASYQRRKKWYLPALFGTGHQKSLSRGNALAPNRRNSLPCTVGSPDKDRAIKGLVVCYVLYYGYEVKDQESGLELTS